jgi:hypothetical protein
MSYTIKKNHPRIPYINLVLKYIQIFKFYDGYYFVMNIFHTFKFFNVDWFFQNNWLDEV